jgi:hypothetical protein
VAGKAAFLQGGVLTRHSFFGFLLRRLVAAGSAIALLAVMFVGLSASPAAAVGTGTISGTVTNAAGGAPLSGVCVGAYAPGADVTLLSNVATAADGTYTIPAVPVGNVIVRFDGYGLCPGGVESDFVQQWNNNQPTDATANTVAVTDSTDTPGVSAALVAGGKITGTVTASSGGAPLNHICVAAYIPGVDELLISATSTVANGTYTLTGVPTGGVHVQFWTTGFCPGGVAASFAPQWWNGQATADTATIVNVSAGGTQSNINAALLASGSFSGTVTAFSGGAPLQGICVAAYKPFVEGVPAQLITSTSTAADGTYNLSGAPVGNIDVKFYATSFCPGGTASSYAMQWYNNQPLQASANEITIGAGANTPNVNAALVAGGSISGTVTSAATLSGLSGICVAAFSTDANPVVVASTGTSAGGGYTLDGIPAGNVQVRFNSQGFCPGGVLQHFATQWYNDQPSAATADLVAVASGANTPGVNAAMAPPLATSFSIKVNGGSSASLAFGAPATLTETGLPDLYGTVVFSSAGHPNLCTITMAGAGSSANTGCQTSALPAGSYSPITAAFTDTDGAFANSSSTNSVSLTVTPIATAFAITANGSATSASIIHGAQATLAESGLPAPATGSVVFSSPGHANLCTITRPATSCLTPAGLAIGSYTPVSAVYNPGNGNFTTSTSTNTVSLTVSATPTAFTISATPASINYGSTASLDMAGLPGGATGTVVFSAAGQPNLCTITLPATSCQTSAALPAGTYSPISAVFTGDVNYTGSTSTNTASLTVAKSAAAFSIKVNGVLSAQIVQGSPAKLSQAGLPAAATGTVVFSSPGHANLCSVTLPAQSCTAPNVGAYAPVSAHYSGDANFDPSTSNPVSIKILSKPGAPLAVHASKPSVANVTVTWVGPRVNGGARITGYVITFGAKSLWVPASMRHATFAHLARGTYYFRVRAINRVGLGAWSTKSNVVHIS